MGEKRIGVVFPGQGSQYVGMGKDLYQNYRIFAEVFDAGSEICGFDITRLCFEGPLEKLTETEICQVCVFAVGYGAWRVLQHEFPFVPLLQQVIALENILHLRLQKHFLFRMP